MMFSFMNVLVYEDDVLLLRLMTMIVMVMVAGGECCSW